jgi:hypothetical protein
MEDGPKFNIRRYPNKGYEAFLQNKEFAEYLAKNFNNSIERIAEAVAKFKAEMPDVQLPEFDMSPLEEGLATINHNIILMIEEQRATNDYIKELIRVMMNVAGIRKYKE